MAKKATNKSTNGKKPAATRSTPVRNTVIPKKAPAARPTRKEVSFDMIAERAYLISISGNGGSQDENWYRAERELRGI